MSPNDPRNTMTHNIETTQPQSAPHNQMILTRVLHAPVERVFQAWTDPSHLLRWFAPEGCQLVIAEYDCRPGGRLHLCIEGPDGSRCWIAGTFMYVEAPTRFAYVTTFSDATGRRLSTAEAGRDPEWPDKVTTGVDFEDQGERTLVTIRQNVASSVAIRTGAQPSWLSQLHRLEDLLRASVSPAQEDQ